MRRTGPPRLRRLALVERVPDRTPELVVAVDGKSVPVRVAVHGEVDLASAAQLRAVLDEVSGRDSDVVLDCAGMSFIDACGLGVFAAASRRLQAQGRVLRVARPSPFLRALLSMTRLDRLLQVEPTAV